MPNGLSIVHSDPEILSGTPVFVGTRVPVQSLSDYLAGGDTLDEFLRQFPTVRREQAALVAHRVPEKRRDLAWSAISSGTGWGVALAGPLAIVAGDRLVIPETEPRSRG